MESDYLKNLTNKENERVQGVYFIDVIERIQEIHSSNLIHIIPFIKLGQGYISGTVRFVSEIIERNQFFKYASCKFRNVNKRKTYTDIESELGSRKQLCSGNKHSLHSGTKNALNVDVDYSNDYKECKKNPGHKKFIPMKDFSMEHLPIDYQDDDLVETIKILGKLTVQITVNDLGSSKLGSGKVIDIKKNTSSAKCACDKCQRTPEPSKTWWKVIILTSTHVVSDKDEAQNAKVKLFFSSKESALVSVDGVEVIKSCTSSEVCRLVCVTCDQGLAERLDALLDEFTSAYERTFDKFWDVKKVDKLVVIVSHPHGLPQMVSIGKSGKIVQTGEDLNVLTYTNVTCPGSTGAFLYII